MWSHNSVLNGWSECLSDLHLPIKQNQDINTEDHPDITMFDPNTGQNLDLNVSQAHPWSQNIIRGLARKMVMLPRQEKKRK